jgi:hypothetical protein
VQLYLDARALGSLTDVAGVPLWELPDRVADELRLLMGKLGPLRDPGLA